MTIYTGLIKYHRDPGGNACKDTVSDKAACTDEIDGTTYCRRSIKLNFLCNNEVSEIPQFEEVEEAEAELDVVDVALALVLALDERFSGRVLLADIQALKNIFGRDRIIKNRMMKD